MFFRLRLEEQNFRLPGKKDNGWKEEENERQAALREAERMTGLRSEASLARAMQQGN